jgi:imidazolonepropionase-like amidohydrolase
LAGEGWIDAAWCAAGCNAESAGVFWGCSDSIGAVEAGKLADLVLPDADPLADIGNVDKIAAVVVGGSVG